MEKQYVTNFDNLKSNSLIEGDMWTGLATFVVATARENTVYLTIEHDGKTVTKQIQKGDQSVWLAEEKRGVSWKAYLAIEMLRHKYATNFGISDGNADPLPHQLDTIWKIASTPGRIRFLIADEPGGGKTVVGSKILQELWLQRDATRVLIVVPAMLKQQWKSELKKFINMDSKIISGDPNRRENPWLDDGILITSADYAKRPEQTRMLQQTKYDLIIVDEAHNFNADNKNISKKYKLGELLEKITKHMIFLTATPHRGKSENFRLLLKLLEPDLFADKHMDESDIYGQKEKIFIRHMKNEMIYMDGNDLFLGRSVISVKYEMSDVETTMYEKVSEYVRVYYKLSLDQNKNKIYSFALLMIQKRMASSTHALLETLKRRHAKLLEQQAGRNSEPDDSILDDDYDFMTDEDKEKVEDMALNIVISQTPAELQKEIDEISILIEMAQDTINTNLDKKLEKLIELINNLNGDKLLIFSEYRDTLDYLHKHLKTIMPDYKIARIDGMMPMWKREEEQRSFRDKCQIMLATDAAREGINLQFCHRMVNYDLPWSPIALEQRMGRLHRYHQKNEVVISNMLAANTMEGKVLEKLFEKIESIKNQFPTFDIIGQVLSGGNLKDLMEESIKTNSIAGVEESVQDTTENIDKINRLLGKTPVKIDYVEKKRREIELQCTDGVFLTDAITHLFEKLGGSVVKIDNKTNLTVPKELQGNILRTKKMSFNDTPEKIFTRGGKIYNHLMAWISNNCMDDLKLGSCFKDPQGRDGWIVFNTLIILNKNNNIVRKKLIAHFYDMQGNITEEDAFVLKNMESVENQYEYPKELVNKVADSAKSEMNDITGDSKVILGTKIYYNETSP